MSVPARLRVAGWLVSLAGAAIIIIGGGIGGGFSGEHQVLPMIGAVVMVLGIILTSTSPLVATLMERRRIKERLEELKSAPPERPAPPK